MVTQVKENYTEVAHTYNIKLSVPKLTRTGHYFIKQKLTGVALIIVGIAASIVTDNYIFGLFMLLIGIALITTRDRVIFD